MEVKRSKHASFLLWTALAVLLSQELFVPVISAANFEGQKNYYTPDPNARSPPPVTYTPPAHGSGGHHATPTPSHGTPSHGGGSYGGTPPANCGNPPSGGHHHPTPSPPTGGGGGYYRPPPTSTPTTPSIPTPSTPTPSTPTPSIPTPSTPTPTIGTPPTTPIITPGTPTTPGITIPSPPFPFDPNSPPFTCTYWRNHPTLIWGLFGWWGTLGSAFGVTSVPGFGANMNLLQALSNTRSDGLGELYREGTAALLNSMAHTRFPYTTSQVRDSFVAALGSNKAAAAQAQLFKLANEGRNKPRA
ncbi:Protodermal factor 1 [Sesamum alatum]|uniref:Protodermal factor 1 n=1 Tax=Sesamum alatum TaxID=300844 RepID=A0AAE2CYP9_9LAMI|nr:Protodermal factor 1 [Sesamum alatum]